MPSHEISSESRMDQSKSIFEIATEMKSKDIRHVPALDKKLMLMPVHVLMYNKEPVISLHTPYRQE